jgi:hypothetical protein
VGGGGLVDAAAPLLEASDDELHLFVAHGACADDLGDVVEVDALGRGVARLERRQDLVDELGHGAKNSLPRRRRTIRAWPGWMSATRSRF